MRFQQTVLKEGTEQYDRFVHIPQPLMFKVYLFNVTNPKAIVEGATPIVDEVGPYVYRQYREKNIVSISPDKKVVSFRQYQKFIFDEEASSPRTEQDRFTMLNTQMNVS